MPTSEPAWDDTTAVDDAPSWDDTTAVKEKDTTRQIAGREVPFNPAQYVAGGGGMAGISLIPAPGPARDNPLGSYIPETPDIKGESILGQLAAAPVNVGKHLLEGVASPLGVATLGLGPIPRVAQGLIGAGFGVPAAVEGVKRVYRGTALADPQEAIEGALQAITGGLITGGSAHGALTKEIPKIPEPQKPPLIPPPKIVDVHPPQTAPVNLEVPEVAQEPSVMPKVPNSIIVKTPNGNRRVTVSARVEGDGAVMTFIKLHNDKTGSYDQYPVPPNRFADLDQAGQAGFDLVREKYPEVTTTPSKESPPSVVAAGASPEAPSVSAAEVPVAAGAEPAKVEPNVTPEVTQGGVPPIIGMGGATLDEVVPTATSLKNAAGDLERVGIGLKDASETVTHNMEEAWAKADTAEQNQPGIGANLATMLKRDPNMGLTDVESALLLRHKVDLFNRLNDAAEKTHVGDEKARSAAQAIHDDLKIQYEDLLDAARDRGESWGREGRWRQAMLKDDFTFSSTDDFNRYSRSVKGEDLPGEKITEAEKKAKSVKEANDAADKSTKEVLDDITNQSGTPPVDRINAEQRAIDAANKTVRENAIRIADLESKSRVAKTVAEQETLNIQKKAAQKAMESAQQQARESAVRLAREESKVKERARLDEQSKAAQKALDAASKTVREAAVAKAKLETKSRVATSVRERQAAKVQVKAAQKAIDAADRVHRSAAIALAKAQRALQDNPIKAVWDKVREYIQKGVESPDDIRTKVATDLGMNVDHVTRIMQQSAKTKRLMDQAWLNQQKAQLMRQAAKRWVKDLNTPAYEKALAAIPRALFAAKVFGHGTVALGTHAPSVLFQPKFWNVYTRDFGKMYKMVANPAFYEQQVRDLVRRPNYGKAQRGGLDNNPAVREEFASKPTASFFGKLSGAGNRGYTILKILRQDMFDQMYSKLPRSMQVQDGVIQGLAKDINSSTGSSKTMLPPGSNIALFAPRLQISRFNQLVGDPITAFRTFADWKHASAGEKMFAQNQIKQKLWIGGTLLSALAANQGLLTAMGSKQKINGIPEFMGGGGIDPLASDFLKFKIAGHDVAYGSALLNMAKLPVRLAYALAYEGKGSKFVHEDERWYKILGDFARSQASPFAGTVADLAFGRDFQGRPLPRAGFGLLPGRTDIPKRLALQGITKPYSWTEYGLQQFAPIPASEFLKEVWGKGLGMSDQQIEQYFKSFIVGAAMAGTGSRVTEDKKLEQSQ